MSATANAITINRPVRLRAIALPLEHGSWGFLFEPLVAAVFVAPSLPAFWIVSLVVGAFLARQPLKVYLNDRLAGRNLPQTAAALKFTALYGALAAAGLAGALATAPAASFLPFAAVMPFAAYQIYSDALRRSRRLGAELLGAVAISSSAAAIALAGGWSPAAALALWSIFAARLIPSIVYVRNRLLLEKGKDGSKDAVVAANLCAFVFVAALAVNALIPALTVGIFAILTLRAAVGISPYRRRVKAMKIGVYEVVYGALVVLSVIFGYIFHI